jgi:hypothetical protein
MQNVKPYLGVVQKQLLAAELATQAVDWGLGALISFAEEKLIEEGNWHRSDTPKGNVYSWTTEELMQFVYDRYAEEIEGYSEDTILELISSNKQVNSDN